MNYERMWYQLKERMVASSRNTTRLPENRKAFEEQLKIMADIEVKESHLKIYGDDGRAEMLFEEKQPEEKKSNIGPGSCAKEEPGDVKVIEDGKEMLKDIFGKDFVDNLEDLEKKLDEEGVKVILVDAELKIPEELEKKADEKEIMIGRAQCGAIRMGAMGPLPLPFLFPGGFLK